MSTKTGRSAFARLFRQCVEQVERGWPKDEQIDALFDMIRVQPPKPQHGHLGKWLTRAVDTLARNQDDERVVFLLDFDRAFPNGVEAKP